MEREVDTEGNTGLFLNTYKSDIYAIFNKEINQTFILFLMKANKS